MSEITESEIKSMTKEQNYMRGYEDGKSDVLDKIRAEIKAMFPPSGNWMYDEGHEHEHTVCEVLVDVLQIIDKYREGANKYELS